MLDSPWKIAGLVGALLILRLAAGMLKASPQRGFLVELFNSALIAFGLVFLLIRPFLLQAFFIPSGSMEPTLLGPDRVAGRAGDRILVNKFVYRLGSPRRGDVVVFRAPPQALPMRDGSSDFIKRVVALAGDEVEVVGGEGVYVNGERLEEPYLSEPPYYDWPHDNFGQPLNRPYVVPAGHILVMGDNRNNSNDSHLWRDPLSGENRPALSLKNVVGKALIIFWPPGRFGKLVH